MQKIIDSKLCGRWQAADYMQITAEYMQITIGNRVSMKDFNGVPMKDYNQASRCKIANCKLQSSIGTRVHKLIQGDASKP